MHYADARGDIWTGDCIAVRGRRGPFAWLTRLVTRSPYTHVGIAMWIEGGLWVAHLNGGGNAMVPLSQWADQDFDVFAGPAPSPTVVSELQGRLARRTGYSPSEILAIVAHDLLRFKLPADPRKSICSSWVADIYHAAGWQHLFHVPVPSPAELCAALGEPKLRIAR